MQKEKLVNKVLSDKEKKEILENLSSFSKIILDKEQIKDVRNIAHGVYSPLEGFLKEKDFKRVVKEMRLENGKVWSIPIVLDISKEEAKKLKDEKEVVLINSNGDAIAVLKNIEIYTFSKDFFAQNVFQTQDKKHPGAEDIYRMQDYLIGGEIGLLEDIREPLPDQNFTPQETREEFQKRGWKTIVAFQTRNVPHRGHEFLQKEELKETDGLLIQPVIGEKKLEDFKDEYIIASYEILIEKHYPEGKAMLGILPLKMRYAGPREAVFHALIRKNFGCTHFIIGRDHAGVGNYYGPFEAQEIFDKFKEEEIGIKIMKFVEVAYCPECEKHVFINTCKHDKLSFSGTRLRQKIEKKEVPEEYIIRKEIYNLLANSHNSLVDAMYKKKNNNKKGFVLWFTGLSQSGKTTTADEVAKTLQERGVKTERLDGDIVREGLSRDLGFSKEDRDENIRRVSFVSKLLARNNIGVIASFISPYKKERENAKKIVEPDGTFIEVFCKCPLEVCEKRDTRGLYKKARKGEIENFTGISDPYEEPEDPQIIIETNTTSTADCIKKIVDYLEDNDFI